MSIEKKYKNLKRKIIDFSTMKNFRRFFLFKEEEYNSYSVFINGKPCINFIVDVNNVNKTINIREKSIIMIETTHGKVAYDVGHIQYNEGEKE